jgi:UDP-N-acetylmuramoyl-tripeptide--D-alanyl-D-alanine ligase
MSMNGTVTSLYELFLKHPVVSTDSRKVPEGCIFFALRGTSFNGNLFAPDALKQGAAFAVVDEDLPGQDDRCIRVDDSLGMLQQLALHHRKRFTIPVLGITGTNGKTTTKELIRAVLSRKFNTLSTEGNLNNHIGVPLTLLGLRDDTEFAIVEMGANHPGEIAFLCSLSRPGFGLITNIGKAHLEGFGSFEGVVNAKTELYRFLAQAGGRVFVNHDNPLLMAHSEGLERTTYGTGAGSGFRAKPSETGPFTGLEAVHPWPGLRIPSKLFGSYNFDNLLAAVSIGYHFGVDPESVREAISSYVPANNRSQVKETAKNLLILDAYNANPSSMETALLSFSKAEYKNKMVILGDMLELGKESDHEHQKVVALAEQLGFDKAIFVGPVFRRTAGTSGFTAFETSIQALEYLKRIRPACFSILIKGSRGIRLEVVEDAL